MSKRARYQLLGILVLFAPPNANANLAAMTVALNGTSLLVAQCGTEATACCCCQDSFSQQQECEEIKKVGPHLSCPEPGLEWLCTATRKCGFRDSACSRAPTDCTAKPFAPGTPIYILAQADRAEERIATTANRFPKVFLTPELIAAIKDPDLTASHSMAGFTVDILTADHEAFAPGARGFLRGEIEHLNAGGTIVPVRVEHDGYEVYAAVRLIDEGDAYHVTVFDPGRFFLRGWAFKLTAGSGTADPDDGNWWRVYGAFTNSEFPAANRDRR